MVVGGGDSALGEATFLTRFVSTFAIAHRRDSFRASKILQERVFANEKIPYVWDSEVVSADGSTKLESVTLRHLTTGEPSEMAGTGMFFAIGHDRARSWSRARSSSTIRATSWSSAAPPARTKLEGGFACGEDSSTTPVARPSPLPAAAAPRRWRLSGGWPPTNSPGQVGTLVSSIGDPVSAGSVRPMLLSP